MIWYGISFLVIVTLAIFGNIYVYKLAEKKAKELSREAIIDALYISDQKYNNKMK